MTAPSSLTYAVDIVLCIDVTKSMDPIIETVKTKALQLQPDLQRVLEEKQRSVDQMRVKVIAFRDVSADHDPFEISEWFKLPQDDEGFQRFVGGLSAHGGGDLPESGLEALALAMHSDWTQDCLRQRHVIAIWSDDAAHDLSTYAAAIPTEFRERIPASFNDLKDMWDGVGQRGMPKSSARRLVIFAPKDALNESNQNYWAKIHDEWDLVLAHASPAGMGLEDVGYNTILDLLANSIATQGE